MSFDGAGEKASPLESLALFLEVVRRGSMSGAAEALAIDVSVVSRKLSALEQDLDNALFERHSRGVRLTKAGALTEAAFRRILAEDLQLRTALEQLRRLERGVLRISCTGSALAGPLSDVLIRFSAKFPAVQVEIQRLRSREVVSSVRDGLADIGIGFNMEHTPSLDTTVLFEDVLVAVVPPGHPLSGLKEVNSDDIRGYPVASFEFNTQIGELTKQYLAGGFPKVAPHFLTNSLEVLKRFSAGGSGVAILCRSSIWPELRTGAVVAINLAHAPRVTQEFCSRHTVEDSKLYKAFLVEFRDCVARSLG